VGGYENHAVSCGRCGANLEVDVRRGSLLVDVEFWQSESRVYEVWGSLTVSLDPGGYVEWEDRDDHDSEYVDTQDVYDSEARCPTCSRSMGENDFVLWAWNGPDYGASDGVLMDELGYSPDVGPFEFRSDDDRYEGQVLSWADFVLSWKGELEMEASPQVKTVASLPKFVCWENEPCGDYSDSSPYCDDGSSWSCELERRHEGPCMFDPYEYHVTKDGVQVWAWEDDTWVTGERETESGASPAVLAALQADPFAELGL
jgi:hypothetical protein